jgi:hypothetical protein
MESAKNRSRMILSLFSFIVFIVPVLGSNIATFSDTKCKDSLNNIPGPNGYPNGTCTPLDTKGAIGSFQVVDLDPGCSGTTHQIFLLKNLR